MSSRKSRELLYAAIAVVYITLMYLGMNALMGSRPAASSFYGHSMGVVGFILMLMTETLYSLRKRSRLARWGRMSTWLQFHIFTGIVGPYLVLLHSSWKFNGVAGVLTLMTGVIVLSGFIGRYIYTSVPRTADGIALEAEELEGLIEQADASLKAWVAERRQRAPALAAQMDGASTVPAAGRRSATETVRSGIVQRLGSRRALPTKGMDRPEARELQSLLERRNMLRRQARSLQTARRLLATWHTIHIPIGLGLFGLAFVHIAAAIYYATLLR